MVNNFIYNLLMVVFCVVCLENFKPVVSSNLVVIPTPSITNKISASIDESFVLSCASTGLAEERPKSLEWRTPDNEPVSINSNRRVYTILNGDTLRLYFNRLIPSDAGTYTCVGIEASAPREVRVQLELQKKISFKDSPVEQFIQQDRHDPILCKASASPGPEIAWFRKGHNVELKNDDKYQLTNEGLVVKNPQIEDEGVYYCQASVTTTGEVKRLEINVQVMTPPKWVFKPKDTEGVNGQDVIIRCEAFAKPQPVYTWTRNGIVVAGDRFIVSSLTSTGPGTLTIRDLRREDTGIYTCIAENNSGKIESSIKMAVLLAPRIAKVENINVQEGNLAILRCNIVEAYPKAVVRWKYADTQQYIGETSDDDSQFTVKSDDNGKPADAFTAGAINGGWSELHVNPTSRIDNRNFTCVATNKAAVTEQTIQLFVEYRPKLILNAEARDIYYSWLYTDTHMSSGNTAAQTTRAYPVFFTCIADSQPKATITWYFKGIRITPDNFKYRLLKDEDNYSKLEVNPQTINDFGDYQCRADNRLGREERVIQLREATPPRFPPLLKVKEIDPDRVIFNIHPSQAPEGDGGMPIEGYKLQWRFVGAEWQKPDQLEVSVDLSDIELLTKPLKNIIDVEVKSLVPDTEYLFKVAAANKPGVGVWSPNEIKIKTAPRRQPDPVRIKSKENCQASTRCYIEWEVDSNGGSPVRDYLIRWRRISYKDPLNLHVDTNKVEKWTTTRIIKEPTSNFELLLLYPNSFYEIEVLARNDIGTSASQPFRIRTLAATAGDSEAYKKENYRDINKAVIIACSFVGAIVVFLLIDVICLIRNDCGMMALLRNLCRKEKLADYEKANSNPPKIAEHQPPPAKNQYKLIKPTEENDKATIPMIN